MADDDGIGPQGPAAATRQLPVDQVGHPLADRVGRAEDGTGWVATESRSRIVHLTPGRANLLAVAARDGRRPVLVTDELSRLTPAFSRVWQQSGGCWVVRQHDGGLRNGFGGRRLARIEEAWTRPLPRAMDEFAVGHLRPANADALQLTTIIGLRHPARQTTLLGGPVQELAERLLAAAPAAWGAHEPVGADWDRSALTETVRAEMPALATVVAAGPGLSATIGAQRTRHGVEEVDHVVVGAGRPSGNGLSTLRARMADALREVAATGMPLVALQLARAGRADLSVPPYLLPPPTPLSLLVGAPAVRGFGLDVAGLRDRFGAEVVGRPRLPALLFDLGPVGFAGWQRLDAVLAALGRRLLDDAFGPAAAALAQVREEAPPADPAPGPRPDTDADPEADTGAQTGTEDADG